MIAREVSRMVDSSSRSDSETRPMAQTPPNSLLLGTLSPLSRIESPCVETNAQKSIVDGKYSVDRP